MREILFRGQTRRYGEKVRMGDGKKLPSRWVYGGVLQGTGGYSVIYGGEEPDFKGSDLSKWPVYTDTLGQYTGMTDKNGKRIFEGDVVKFTRLNALGYATRRVGDVRYYDELPIFYIMATTGDAWDWCDCEDIEVIGNIHDNPEPLEEEPT
jgi:hypothetical protein